MCPLTSSEASVTGNLNQAWYEGAGCGTLRFGGQGAGRYPTAANVLRDVLALREGARYMLPDDCPDAGVRLRDAQRYYLRLPIGMRCPSGRGGLRHGANTAWRRTGPVPPQAVYALASENKNVFFARLQKE